MVESKVWPGWTANKSLRLVLGLNLRQAIQRNTTK